MQNIKVDIQDMSNAIVEAVENYNQQVTDKMKKAVKKAAKEAASELKKVEPPNHQTGEYAKNWGQTKRYEDAYDIRYVVHNKKRYMLTHLLENGHKVKNQYGEPKRPGALRFVPPYPHIEPTAEKIVNNLVEELKVELGP